MDFSDRDLMGLSCLSSTLTRPDSPNLRQTRSWVRRPCSVSPEMGFDTIYCMIDFPSAGVVDSRPATSLYAKLSVKTGPVARAEHICSLGIPHLG